MAPREGGSGIEADVVGTVPKTMQTKARRLMERLRRDITETTRGQLIDEGVPVAGSNLVDLVNDLPLKRKSNPTGWQLLVQQLRDISLPMELVGNVARRSYIRPATPRATTAAGARSSLRWTPLVYVEHPSSTLDTPRSSATDGTVERYANPTT